MEVASIIVSVLALLISGVAYLAVVHQNRLSATSVFTEWLRDMRLWASEAIDVLAEAAYTCRPAPTCDEESCLLRCRHRLSSLIDRGRFLLPNERKDEIGSHKAGAYRGLRHVALDALVAAENVLGGDLPLHTFPDRKAALIGLRREFVSAVQSIIDPASVNKDIAKILRVASSTRAKDPTLGGLLPNAKNIPTGAQGVMETASKRYELTLRFPPRP